MKTAALVLVAVFIFDARFALGESISASNSAANPPLFGEAQTGCSAQLLFKPARGADQHGFIVLTGPDGKKIELRGGPSKGGSGTSTAPGLIPPGSGDQPTGNPFKCSTTHNWGVVVPYVGSHGNLGQDSSGKPIYSPDGNVTHPTATISIGPGAQRNICKLGNCLMIIIKALGASCKIYTVGTGALRNSNTLVSAALASCGVKDPLPASISAPGWGSPWGP